MKKNQDLLDLCRLNQLRDINTKGILPDDEKEANSQIIDRSIKEIARKIKRKATHIKGKS